MKKTHKRVLSAFLVLGVLVLPCGISLDRETLGKSIIQPDTTSRLSMLPVRSALPRTDPAPAHLLFQIQHRVSPFSL